jgi:hypothetical protein
VDVDGLARSLAAPGAAPRLRELRIVGKWMPASPAVPVSVWQKEGERRAKDKSGEGRERGRERATCILNFSQNLVQDLSIFPSFQILDRNQTAKPIYKTGLTDAGGQAPLGLLESEPGDILP